MAAGAALGKTGPFPEIGFVSPLWRTLETGVIAAKGRVRLVAAEGIRERNGVHVCDKRSAKEVIEGEFGTVEFENIAEGEDGLWGEVRETEEALAKRGGEFFWGLGQREEECFLVVSHSSFLYNTIKSSFCRKDDNGKLRMMWKKKF